MARRADRQRVIEAKLLGARRLLEDVEAGLIDRDPDELRSLIGELAGTATECSLSREC